MTPSHGTEPLDAGEFGAWLDHTREVLRGSGDAGADVPCNGCTACCRSSQFVHIESDETDTLAAIPRELQFRAPGRPDGTMLLGYDERGHCPMLIDDRCSIYELRPRACRSYDCRVLAAAAVELDDDTKQLVAERVQRWRFRHSADGAAAQHAAVEAAAQFLADHPDVCGESGRALTATHRALAAIEIADLFLQQDLSVDDMRAALNRHAR